MKVLELFAGTRSIGKAFEARGHEVYSVDWNRDLEGMSEYIDVNDLDYTGVVAMCNGRPDVIWASPDCTTYSVSAISRHRRKTNDGNLEATSEYARFCDRTNRHVLDLIERLQPRLFFIENPRGGVA